MTTSIKLGAVAPAGASFFLSATAKGEVNCAFLAEEGGDSKDGADSAALGFDIFAASGAETGGGGAGKVGSASVAFVFFAFSRVE
jgi:hypothetical protein